MQPTFRLVGVLEGLSFLILLGIAMPMKYLMGQPEAVRLVGMAHGVLFLGYVALAGVLGSEKGWPARQMAMAVVAAVVPFGTFVFDHKYLRTKSS